eukprot:GHVT01031229.1.p2 GENE.GHVT01031229.1~~GHVT01031229.1.p2  ORF type:complete len:111 (+),score=28.25 GHVT01031229.1:295-627(+)
MLRIGRQGPPRPLTTPLTPPPSSPSSTASPSSSATLPLRSSSSTSPSSSAGLTSFSFSTVSLRSAVSSSVPPFSPLLRLGPCPLKSFPSAPPRHPMTKTPPFAPLFPLLM